MFLSENKKILYTPVNPNFTIIIKVGCKGAYITRTCYYDVMILCLNVIKRTDICKLNTILWLPNIIL